MFWCIVHFQLSGYPSSLLRLECFVQRTNTVSIQVVHDQHDLLSIRLDMIHQVTDFLSPVNSCPGRFREVEYVAAVWLYETEYAGCTVPDVLGIDLSNVSSAHRNRLAAFTEELVRLLVHTPQRTLGIEWLLVDIQDILHACNELAIFLWRDAPVLTEMRPQFIAVQYSADGCSADRLFEDDLEFIGKKGERPAGITFRHTAAGCRYDLCFDLAGCFQPGCVGIGIPLKSDHFLYAAAAE